MGITGCTCAVRCAYHEDPRDAEIASLRVSLARLQAMLPTDAEFFAIGRCASYAAIERPHVKDSVLAVEGWGKRYALHAPKLPQDASASNDAARLRALPEASTRAGEMALRVAAHRASDGGWVCPCCKVPRTRCAGSATAPAAPLEARMVDDQITSLRSAALAASPGPWTAMPQAHEYGRVEIHGDTYHDHDGTKTPIIVDGASVVDAAFIAAANPSAIIAILDRLAVAERERDDYKHSAMVHVVGKVDAWTERDNAIAIAKKAEAERDARPVITQENAGLLYDLITLYQESGNDPEGECTPLRDVFRALWMPAAQSAPVSDGGEMCNGRVKGGL